MNPVRARMVRRAVDAVHRSLRQRLQKLSSKESELQAYLAPLVSGTCKDKKSEPIRLAITLASYLDYLDKFSITESSVIDEEAAWFQRVVMFKRRQRAYG